LNAVEVSHLSKRFGSKTAVDDVTFEVKKGEVFGFLGPNGAGKTTTIKMLTTLIPPSGGEAHVLGYDVRKDGKKIRNRIGVVQQQESYDQALSVQASLNLYGVIWDVPKDIRRQRVEQLLEQFSLNEVKRTVALDLSIGLRRRLQVAREFMHDMDLLFLDEPTVGLDAIARRSTLDFVRETVRDGLTIFFTTHILEEAEYLCDRIAVVNNGKILVVDTPAAIKRQFAAMRSVEFNLLEGNSQELVHRLEGLRTVEKITQQPNGQYAAATKEPQTFIPELYRVSGELGLHLSSIYIAEPSLEEAFISIVRENST
jgi:ABC-2 type transport system ATP-binding protein